MHSFQQCQSSRIAHTVSCQNNHSEMAVQFQSNEIMKVAMSSTVAALLNDAESASKETTLLGLMDQTDTFKKHQSNFDEK